MLVHPTQRQERLVHVCIGSEPGDCVGSIVESLSSVVLVSEAEALPVLDDRDLTLLQESETFLLTRFIFHHVAHVGFGDHPAKRVVCVGRLEKIDHGLTRQTIERRPSGTGGANIGDKSQHRSARKWVLFCGDEDGSVD